MLTPRPLLTPWQRLLAMMEVFPPHYAELQSGVVALGIGMWYLYPNVHTFESATAFSVLAGLGGETFWGNLLVIMGAFQIAGLLYDVRSTRLIMAETSGVVWFFLAIVMCMGNPRSPSLVIFGAFALGMFCALLQIARE